jgi:hypothetical protein
VERRPVFGPVDVLAAEHRVTVLRHPPFAGEREQQLDRLGGDPVLRQVGVDPGRLEREALGATRVGGEQVAQTEVADGAVVPSRACHAGPRVSVSVISSRDGRLPASRRLE